MVRLLSWQEIDTVLAGRGAEGSAGANQVVAGTCRAADDLGIVTYRGLVDCMENKVEDSLDWIERLKDL